MVLGPLHLEVRGDHLHVLLTVLQRISETAQRQSHYPSERQAVGIQVFFLLSVLCLHGEEGKNRQVFHKVLQRLRGSCQQ